MSDRGCCCHEIGERCAHGWDDEHTHRCRASAYFRGHCPDSGCPGDCWSEPVPEKEAVE